ncbi:MAG: hypothetical protein AAGI66_08680 [Cyanobacteria bacterium P01_H01_bin.74]
MPLYPNFIKKTVFTISMAISLAIAPYSLAAPGETNSINNGQNVAGGTYFNTAGNKTTFTNTSGTGIYISPSTTVRGLEVDAGGATTGNGGHLHFDIPNQGFRLDGVIDVNAIANGGTYFGSGGKVTVNAAYMYQSGQILANGVNGGLVNLAVGSLTMTPTARIEAKGVNKGPDCFGNGGVVNIGTDQSRGVIDIQRGAIVDTSGNVIGTYDTNLITIQGGLINIDGIVQANGLEVATSGDGTTTTGTIGGTIALIAHGSTEQLDQDLVDNTPFMSDVRNDFLLRDFDLITQYGNGWVNVGVDGVLSAMGGRGSDGNTIDQDMFLDGTEGGDGGLIAIWAKCGIKNDGLITAAAGDGGTGASVEAPVISGDQFSVAGNGGKGGLGGQIFLAYHETLDNSGTITAQGGSGGAGGNALADATPTSIALAGNGGDGAQGGFIITDGPVEPTDGLGGTFSDAGGTGGDGGTATVGVGENQFAADGSPGSNGVDGEIFTFVDPSMTCDSCLTAPDPEIPDIPVDPTALDPDDPDNSDENLGLFQNQRPVFQEPQTRTIPPLLIALARNNMFFARTYKSVTQEILNLALREYNRQLALNKPDGDALSDAQTLLQKSGVDAEIASNLLDQIEADELQAGNIIKQLLQNIASEQLITLNR